jgi:cytochrome b
MVVMQGWPVWDLPVRVIHWYFPVAIGFMWWSGETGQLELHRWCGYSLLCAALTRLVWGFVGSYHAQFKHFVRGPKAVMGYLRGAPHHDVGHNPLGGWSTLVLLLLIVVQGSTGLFSADDISFDAPLAYWVGEHAATFTEIHETNWGILRTLIFIHIGAIAFYHFVKHQPLLAAMWRGQADGKVSDQPPRSWMWAVTIFLVFAGVLLALHNFAPQAPAYY